jgi:hypothetical protein
VTYPEAIEALRGHPDWWRYDYYGRVGPDRSAVQRSAIELASKWTKPAQATAVVETVPEQAPCCGGVPVPTG